MMLTLIPSMSAGAYCGTIPRWRHGSAQNPALHHSIMGTSRQNDFSRLLSFQVPPRKTPCGCIQAFLWVQSEIVLPMGGWLLMTLVGTGTFMVLRWVYGG